MKIVKLAAATMLATSVSFAAFAADIVEIPPSQQARSIPCLQLLLQPDSVDTLKSPGPLTVFAPTDDAFGALPDGTVESLLKPENKDKLTAILTYHVIAGKVMSTDLIEGMMAKTVEGSEVKIGLSNGAMVNDAKIVGADVAADNGVIHVIDKVLMPGS